MVGSGIGSSGRQGIATASGAPPSRIGAAASSTSSAAPPNTLHAILQSRLTAAGAACVAVRRHVRFAVVGGVVACVPRGVEAECNSIQLNTICMTMTVPSDSSKFAPGVERLRSLGAGVAVSEGHVDGSAASCSGLLRLLSVLLLLLAARCLCSERVLCRSSVRVLGVR